MKNTIILTWILSMLLLACGFSQDTTAIDDAKQRAAEVAESAKQRAAELTAAAKESAAAAADAARAKVDEVKERATAFAESEEGRQASATVLEWIESVGTFYTPWINWVLVAVGIALFISHAGQLIIGKLWALVRGKGFSFFEIVNDFLVAGFAAMALPVALMIPTGREAFISNPLQVLSAAAAGMILGVILYTHGLKQEMLAGQERIDRDRADDDVSAQRN